MHLRCIHSRYLLINQTMYPSYILLYPILSKIRISERCPWPAHHAQPHPLRPSPASLPISLYILVYPFISVTFQWENCIDTDAAEIWCLRSKRREPCHCCDGPGAGAATGPGGCGGRTCGAGKWKHGGLPHWCAVHARQVRGPDPAGRRGKQE
jgi:hypothetical protein